MSLGSLSSNPNVKVIIQDSNAVKAPEYSHTPGRIYAVVKNLKTLLKAALILFVIFILLGLAGY